MPSSATPASELIRSRPDIKGPKAAMRPSTPTMRTEVHFTKFEAIGATCRATKKKAHPEATPLMSQTYQSLPWRMPLNQVAAAPIKALAVKVRGRKVIQRRDVITICPRKRDENRAA